MPIDPTLKRWATMRFMPIGIRFMGTESVVYRYHVWKCAKWSLKKAVAGLL